MKKEKKLIALEAAVCVSLIISVLISSVSSLSGACKNIRENVLRLHIIANSDSEEDQRVKLLVRDELLNIGSELFDGTTDTKNAVSKAISENERLTEAAQRVLSENGFDYGVKIEVGQSRFPTREYENVTLPAGEYTAVRVILGEGQGHNWWCVMFPPMCLGAAGSSASLGDVLSSDAEELVSSGKRYEIKFKIVEWYENIKSGIQSYIEK